jgi:hypothetical protein
LKIVVDCIDYLVPYEIGRMVRNLFGGRAEEQAIAAIRAISNGIPIETTSKRAPRSRTDPHPKGGGETVSRNWTEKGFAGSP